MKHMASFFIFILIAATFMPAPASAAVAARQLPTDRVVKTTCGYAFGYENIDQLKADLLAQAKLLAINELFGEFITASTAVENFVVTSDQIRTSSVGFVRVEGDIAYQHGRNLAEVCVTIVAYATEEDREHFEPIRLSKRHCVTDPKLTTSEIRAFAREEVLVQALVDYDSKLRDADRDNILRLIQRVKYLDSGFVAETETYCVTAEGTVVPIEVMAYLGSWESMDAASQAFIETESGEILIHPIVAATGTAVIHYHRPDGNYKGWELHYWGDTRGGVTWAKPLPPSGNTESSIYFVVDLAPNAKEVGFIVHKMDLKDPGPDMFLNLEQTGNQIWVVSGDSRIYANKTTE